MEFGLVGFCEVMKSWGQSPHEWNHLLIKETPEYSLLPSAMWGHRQKTVINQESDLTSTKSAGARPPALWEINLLLIGQPVYGTVIATPNRWRHQHSLHPRYLVSLLFSSTLSKLLCQASTPDFTTIWDAFLPRYLQSLFSHLCPNPAQAEPFLWGLLNTP